MSRMTDIDKAWLLSFASGQNFYDKKCKNSKVTEIAYISRLKAYCDNVGKNPDELIALKLEGLQNTATDKEFQAEELLEKFLRQDKIFKILEDGKKEYRALTDSSKLGILIAVKSFYDSNRGRSLEADVGEFIEAPEPKKRTPTVQDCLDLENKMKCDRDKFLVWFLESCPVRKATLKQLKFGDLKPLNDRDVPYWLRIEAKRLKGQGKGKYRKAKHVGFLHWYAVQKLEAYKEELKRKNIAVDDNTALFVSYKSTPTGSRKGLAQAEFFIIFRDASELAWRDLSKKRFSPHDLRDVLSTVLLKPQVRANSNLTKPLTSHVPTGIEATYENPEDTEEIPNSDLLTVFKSCLPYLIPETLPELKAELNVQKVENQETKRELKELENKIDENTKQLQEVREDRKAIVEQAQIPDLLLKNPVFRKRLQELMLDAKQEQEKIDNAEDFEKTQKAQAKIKKELEEV
jgi:integrase